MIAAAICLAALAGFVDALGFLSLGGFFVAFMSGNTTRFGVALGADAPSQAWQAARLVLTFVIGVMGGTLIAQALPHWRKPAVLAAVTMMLVLAACCHGLGIDQAALLLTAAAMGAENGIFQRDGEVSIGLTYMTGTLVRFAQNAALALTGGSRWAWVPYLLLWLGFLIGVFGGARAYTLIGLGALWIAAGTATVLTIVVGTITRPQ
jgi:uncharacterized membrane protein YoaK (UPF0700 family)